MPVSLPRRIATAAQSRFETAWDAVSKPRAQDLWKGLVLALGVLLSAPAQALDASEMFADPAEEARARDIGRDLRCLVCQNESIFDSNAGLARDLRVLVRERMVAGDSDGEVLDFVHERYGDYALLKPRVTAQTYLLWGAPAIFLVLGGAAVLGYHRRRALTPAGDALSPEDRREAQRLLRGGE